MSFDIDALITYAILDAEPYVRGAKKVVKSSLDIKAGLTQASDASKRFQASLDIARLGMDVVAKFGQAAAGVGAAIVGLSAYSIKAYGDLEALKLGLEAIVGSAELAEKRFQQLRQIAKAPGIDLPQAIGGFNRLAEQPGISQEFALRTIQEAANANARVGGSAETFDRILLAIAQIAGKPTLEGQELRQLAEANLNIAAILERNFGSSDPDQLRKQGTSPSQVLNALITEWSQLQRVSGGVKNSLVNLQSSIQQGAAEIGSGLAGSFMQVVGGLDKKIQEAIDDGTPKVLGESLATQFEALLDGLGFDVTGDALIDFGAIVVDVTDKLRNAALNIGSVKSFAESIWDFFGSIGESGPAKDGFVNVEDPDGDSSKMSAGELYRRDALAERRLRRARQAKKAAEDSFANAQADTKPPKSEAEKHLEKIEVHTRKVADAFDSNAIGGSDALRKGISVFDQRRENGVNRTPRQTTNIKHQMFDLIDSMLNQKLAEAGL